MSDGDFFEDDEDIADVLFAFLRGPHGYTDGLVPPRTSSSIPTVYFELT